MSESQTPPPQADRIDDPVRNHLGAKLREYYGAILAEPVPDRLISLLDQLELQERAGPPAAPPSTEDK